MNNYINEAPVASYTEADYERSIVNSSLWAAAGDAIGWMTELSGGVNGVMHRTGHKLVTEPVDWQRRIGGRTGVKVDLPAGTYSDDTQLRLCVSRAIRGNGSFDVEAFAKIEVTTWQGYCLGAGIGSKAAATNLTKRGVNWFSNFFDTDHQRYITAGGNGAAMRIQPHVWAANGTLDEMILRVMRDAIVTHGHPHGFCGAVFHALCLWITLSSRNIPSLDIAKQFISYMDKLPRILEKDNELHAFWKPAWERESGGSLVDAIHIFQKEALHDFSLVEDAFNTSPSPDYHDILNRLGCLTDKYRGSGFKTAFAALVLSILYSSERIEDALTRSANELESDTDTIATMAGAILGSLVEFEPNWQIQDM
ncbi:MAG: ADP-ribosylglycohydrolase family protein, partial [Lentilitoribacter sp.]